MRRDKWLPTETSWICSVHFNDDCFRRYNSKMRLNEDAVPSIFLFPAHLHKEVNKHNTAPLTSTLSCLPSTSDYNDTSHTASSSVMKMQAML